MQDSVYFKYRITTCPLFSLRAQGSEGAENVMKRLIGLLLCLLLMFSFLLPVRAAEDTGSGFFRLGQAEGVDIVPLSPAGDAVAAVRRTVGGVEEVFYPGSASLAVTLKRTEAGRQYLLLLRRKPDDGILFAEQSEGGGSLSFSVPAPRPEAAFDYELIISSDAEGFATLFIPLAYMPRAESADEPAPAEEPPSDNECRGGVSCPLSAFSDLEPGAWYHDGIHYALERGLMNGVGDGLFSPSGPASRAMLVTMLWRMEGMPEAGGEASFSDVPDGEWFSEAVHWAAAQGLVSGYGDGRFGPGDNISREQLVTIIFRRAERLGESAASDGADALSVFIDAERISDWARQAMQWAAATKLISGVGGGRLSPEVYTSRAQLATVFMRLADARGATE